MNTINNSFNPHLNIVKNKQDNINNSKLENNRTEDIKKEDNINNKVKDIKERIDNGTYKIDLNKTAQSIMDNLT